MNLNSMLVIPTTATFAVLMVEVSGSGREEKKRRGGKKEDKGIDSLHLSSILKKSQADLYAVSLGSSLCQVDIGSTRHPYLLWKKLMCQWKFCIRLYIYIS